MICYLFTEPVYFLFSSDVPQLLYYSHIPIGIISLIIGLFVFLKGKNNLLNQLLFAIALCFSLWIFSNLILWTNVHSSLMLFVWSFLRIFSSLISILCVYFVYVFLENKDVSTFLKVIFLLLVIPVIVLAPTRLNLTGFNLTNCDAFMFEGGLFQFYRVAVGVLAMVWIFFLLIKKYSTTEINFKKQILPMGIGIELFLFSFFVVTFLAAYLTDLGILSDSRIEFYGLFGMAIFMAFITFLIVRFNTFKVKVLGAQALLTAQGVLVGSLLFIEDIDYIRIVISLSLIVFLVLAIVVVRGVKREIDQREQIQDLATRLKSVNSILSHDVKGVLGKNKLMFKSLLDGDFGAISEDSRPFLHEVHDATEKLIASIMTILESGHELKLNPERFDLKAVVSEAISSHIKDAEAKGLKLISNIQEGDYSIVADKTQLITHVFYNLIENAINYTLSGSIEVGLAKKDANTILFMTKDTGVGISAEDKEKLFKEGGHGKDSIKVNVHSTGYGLFIAKKIVDAHGGKIWAESEGPGKGSRFWVELPVTLSVKRS